MEPKIVSRPAFTVVGLKYRGKNENNEIPQLWEQLYPEQAAKIQHKVDPNVSYGVEGNFDTEAGVFDYLAGYQVSDATHIPEGMDRWDVPAQTYAVFKGTLPEIMKMYSAAYKEWLPQSDYQRAQGPEFELYDEDFDPQRGKFTMYVYVPVTLRAS